jgi:NAD(P)-dependent dehydrogenase (short-subunit alcohol dehydrogenase family)
MSTVLITGANRGLGLEFCKQYAQEGWQVIACSRNTTQADELQKLAAQYGNIQLEDLDVAQFGQIDRLAQKLQGQAIDVLINNAGVYGDETAHGFGQLDYDVWSKTLLINTQAPVKMAEAFLVNIKSGQKKLLVSVSSLMGSLADNTSGGSILYRSSKAGLNAAMKSLAIQLKDQAIGVIIFHPGWVRTDMGGPNGLIDAYESVHGMCSVIADFTLAQTGNFLKYDGSKMPW